MCEYVKCKLVEHAATIRCRETAAAAVNKEGAIAFVVIKTFVSNVGFFVSFVRALAFSRRLLHSCLCVREFANNIFPLRERKN